MARALITCGHLTRHFEHFRSQFMQHGVEPVIPELTGQQFSAEEMAQHILDADVVIAGDDFIDAAVLDAGKASRLKAVIKWGIGTDSIDKAHASAIGMPVYNTPGVFGEEVADLAFSHLLLLTRGTHLMHTSVSEGAWFKAEGRSLSGMTAGVIGLGSIGRAIARRADAFGMTVVGYDVAALPSDLLAQSHIEQLDFDRVLGLANVLFIACALTPENRHLINAASLAKLPKGAFVVNVSRGPLVDEGALASAIETGHVEGAGLDVFENEPLPMDAPLRKVADKCTFSTHNGSNTREAVARINQMTIDMLFHILGLKPMDASPNRVA